MVELKPCPFCGEKDLIDYGIMGGTMEGFDYVQCVKCGAEIHSIHNGKHIEAIEAWNMRAETVKEQPDGDMVEVVRCNYCKNNATGCVSKGTIWCVRYHARRPIDGYCSYGERKEVKNNA